MNYNKLLKFAADLGYELSMAGAETYRVEESCTRILAAYGIEADAFAIPNSLTVSLIHPNGEPATRMRRIGFHGTDLDSVERLSALSRRICQDKPDIETATLWLEQTKRSCRTHSFPVAMLGNFLAAVGFAILFGGGIADALVGGLSAIVVGIMTRFFVGLKTSRFFSTTLCAIPLAFIPYFFEAVGIISNVDAAITGAVMVLIPGLLFTHAMRDIIFGDTNSGINRIIQVLLITIAIACGTAVAWNLASALWGAPQSVPPLDWGIFVECIAALLGALGFSIMFNLHGPGILLCVAGGVATWIIYCASMWLGVNQMIAMMIAGSAAAIYAEVMARVRKYPAIGYLIIGVIVVVPGSSLYYTISYIIQGDMERFSSMGLTTIGLAGMLAMGILLVSTIVRMWAEWKVKSKK